MFKPLEAKYQGVQSVTTMMARKGMNQEVFPPFQDKENAELIVNYFVDADGSLVKRKGLKRQAEVSGIAETYFRVKWLNYSILGYSTTIAAWNGTSFTNIKTNFTAGARLTGRAYGDYFFVNVEDEGVWRISQTLAYDAQTANFTAGRVIQGATSGATATILEDNDTGTAGTLTLGNIQGTFQDNEVITETTGGTPGSATVNGTLTFASTEVTDAPKGKVMEIIGPRMFVAALLDDRTAAQFCDIDDGSNPPFETWSVGTGTTEGGKIINRTAGEVTGIDTVAQFFVVFYEDGKAAYYFQTAEEGGSLKRVDVTQMDRRDMGGSGPTLSTPKGLFYVNEGGVHSLIGIGQPNVPYSDQEIQNSQLLGAEYFDNIDFSNGKMMYDPKSQTLFITCARESVKNNLVLAYNMQNNAFVEIRGWNIADFYLDGSTFYGSSSVNGKIYELFTGYDDDGANIGTDFLQEIKLGSLTNRTDIHKIYGNAQLWNESNVTVSFGTFNRLGEYTADRASFSWDAEGDTGDADEWGSAVFGGAAWGGGYTSSGSLNSFDGCSPMIRNVERAKIRVTSNDKSPHIINFFQIVSRTKAPFRRRGMARDSV